MNRLSILVLCGAAAAAALPGCSRREESAAPAARTAPAEAPAPAAAPAAATPAPADTAAMPSTSTSADATGTSGTSAAAGSGDLGSQVYAQTCVACHGAGVAGAPKLGDKADWGPRIAKGNATLYDHAIKGFTGAKGMMPPKGGSSRPDADIKAAVDYMVSQAKG